MRHVVVSTGGTIENAGVELVLGYEKWIDTGLLEDELLVDINFNISSIYLRLKTPLQPCLKMSLIPLGEMDKIKQSWGVQLIQYMGMLQTVYSKIKMR